MGVKSLTMGDYPPGVTGKMIDALEGLPFSDGPERCGNCKHFDGTFCTKDWNNLDEAYKVDWRDEKSPENDWCDDWEEDG